MLVLSRRVGESLFVGPRIKVSILSIDGASVYVGIEAPKDTAIRRRELHGPLSAPTDQRPLASSSHN